MKHIVLFGAGKSATCLIDYLLKEILDNDWKLTVCDSNLELARFKTGNAENVQAVAIQVEDEPARNALIQPADLVISLLPPELHLLLAKTCIAFRKHLLTASYLDEKITSLGKEIKERKILFLCEMGLDPGIDHMSAMRIIEKIKKNGGKITSFRSHCGGLISPESDDNPWHYKVTWNPRNVVNAGRQGASYLYNNQLVNLSYGEVFKNASLVDIPGAEALAWYPNRDSIPYISLYTLQGIATFVRTTLRHPAFCRGWQRFIEAGCTSVEDTEEVKHCRTVKEWFDTKVSRHTLHAAHKNYLQPDIGDPYLPEFTEQLHHFGYNGNEPLPAFLSCSADILQHALETKLVMKNTDKDRIIMLHEIEYEEADSLANSNKKCIRSCLILNGESNIRTAMAKSVGLPLGIAAKLILQNEITLTGLHIPTHPGIYEPVLAELDKHGIVFKETEKST